MEAIQSIEQYYPLEHRGVLSAAELYDRSDIEAEAWDMIKSRGYLPVVETSERERHDNARTALMEALTASGHLSRVEISGSVEEINAQVVGRLLNGWDEALPVHEKMRRFAELCEELTIHKVHLSIVSGDLPPGTAVSVISDYPEAMTDSDATSLGYRSVNKKGMVRSTGLRQESDGSFTRVIEQVSRSNGTWNSTYEFMKSSGIKTTAGYPDIVALQTPLVYAVEDYAEGVVDLVRRLDMHAGQGITYGDPEGQKNHPAYDQLRSESARRERDIQGFVGDLAKLEEQLDILQRNGMTANERNIIFKEEVDRILTAICTLEPNYATDTYGKKAEKYFYEAAVLVSRGETGLAQQLLDSTSHLKQTVTFCGMSISLEVAKGMGLSVNSYGEAVEKGKESWQWKSGVCQVKSCPTRPGKTTVGPCSVCKGCQARFDKGINPTASKPIPKKPQSRL